MGGFDFRYCFFPFGVMVKLTGLLVRWQNEKAQIKEKVWLRFVEGNPCSDLTIQYLRGHAQMRFNQENVFW
jgi:hypothetical protein